MKTTLISIVIVVFFAVTANAQTAPEKKYGVEAMSRDQKGLCYIATSNPSDFPWISDYLSTQKLFKFELTEKQYETLALNFTQATAGFPEKAKNILDGCMVAGDAVLGRALVEDKLGEAMACVGFGPQLWEKGSTARIQYGRLEFEIRTLLKAKGAHPMAINAIFAGMFTQRSGTIIPKEHPAHQQYSNCANTYPNIAQDLYVKLPSGMYSAKDAVQHLWEYWRTNDKMRTMAICEAVTLADKPLIERFDGVEGYRKIRNTLIANTSLQTKGGYEIVFMSALSKFLHTQARSMPKAARDHMTQNCAGSRAISLQ